MKKIFILFCFVLICLFFNQSVFAQDKYNKNVADTERFSAGVLIGFNNAQIDGDFQKGFDKFGLTGGIRGIARINSRLELNIEMLYSSKGSQIFSEGFRFSANPKKDRIIDLNYVDAPIYFKYLLKDLATTWHVELGGIYSRLINTEITEILVNPSESFSYENIAADFDRNDIAVFLGFGHTWKNGFAINGRYAYSIKKFYRNTGGGTGISDPEEVQFLRNYYYSLNLSYTIFQRKLKGK